jgi:DNA-binding MarR family transcriptional regulator
VAVYADAACAPRVIDIEEMPVDEFIETASATVHEACRAEGSDIPYTVIREVTENLVHANFAEPVISILNRGETVRFADQGPGFDDKERAMLPGFTTARGEAKRYIRGVGSGLPLVRDYLVHSGGSICIEDNLGGFGSVVTLTFSHREDQRRGRALGDESRQQALSARPLAALLDEQLLIETPAAPPLRMTARQLQVLALVLEAGIAGPSLVSKELGVGLSTAYRDLASLEENGLIASENGKRSLTPEGIEYLKRLNQF